MYIKAIEVTDVQPVGTAGGFTRAVVAFHGDDSAIHLSCRTAANDQSEPLKRRTLIFDAVRQLRRMPEYRTGSKRFSFAPGLISGT